jgi:hypothetical protein
MDKVIVDIKGQLLFKVEGQQIRDVYEHLKLYSKYEDFKLLYGKCMPAVNRIETEIVDLHKSTEQVRLMIKQLDESMTQKVNKVTFDEIQIILKSLATKKMI